VYGLVVDEISGTEYLSGSLHTEESARLVIVNSTPLAVHAVRRKWVVNAPSARVRSGHFCSTRFMRPGAIRVLPIKVIVLTQTINGHKSLIVSSRTRNLDTFQRPCDYISRIV